MERSNHKRFGTLYIYLCCRAGNRMENFLEYYRSWMANISYIRYFGESWEKVSLSENFGKRLIDKANRFVCQVLRKQSSRGQSCHCIAPRTSLTGL